MAESERTENQAGREALRESDRVNQPAAPTWPSTTPGERSGPAAPPVGMNWDEVAVQFSIDVDILRHSGSIILPGDYFPSPGYFIKPQAMTVRRVDVGDFALQPGYFIGDVATSNYRIKLPLTDEAIPGLRVISPHVPLTPIIGLFGDEAQARRAKERILQNALGSGVRIEPGPLGVEIHVRRAELPGRVASAIAGHSGAVLSVGGVPVLQLVGAGPSASGQEVVGGQADVQRAGTGVTGQTQAPAVAWGSSQQA